MYSGYGNPHPVPLYTNVRRFCSSSLSFPCRGSAMEGGHFVIVLGHFQILCPSTREVIFNIRELTLYMLNLPFTSIMVSKSATQRMGIWIAKVKLLSFEN